MHSLLGGSPADALVAIPCVNRRLRTQNGTAPLSSFQLPGNQLLHDFSIVFFTDLRQLPVGGKMVSFVQVTEIVYLNISSKCMTCKYMYVQCAGANYTKKFYAATYTYSILWKIKQEDNVIFIFMKPCVGSVD